MMSLNTILKRATSFLRFTSEEENHFIYEDGDIVYCKNNVCVHTPSKYRAEGSSIHHPGYMVVKCHAATSDNKTLTLSWIPNERLKKNHDLIYNGPKCEDEVHRFSINADNDSDTYSVSSVIVTGTNKLSEDEVLDSSLPSEVKCEETSICSTDNQNVKDPNEEDNDSGIATKSSSSLTVTTMSDESIENSPDGDKYHEGKRSSNSSNGGNLGTGSSEERKNSNSDLQNHVQKNETVSDKPEDNDKLLEDLTIKEEDNIADEMSTKSRYIPFSEERKNLNFDLQNHEQKNETVLDKPEDNDKLLEDLTIKEEDNIEDEVSTKSRYIPFSEERKNSNSDLQNHVQKNETVLDKPEDNDKLLEDQTIKEEDNIADGATTKSRYISSSESSSDNGKHTEVTEVESSFQVETNDTDDEISLASSMDSQASPPPRYFSSKARDQWYDRSAESMAISANLAFPESPSTVSSLCPTPVEGGSSPVRRLHKCGIFSVDLGHMKSLRLFFSDEEKTCGQLVIASQESQYKILHFHHGGLDKLAAIFEDWNFLVNPLKRKNRRKSGHDQVDSPTDPALKQFSVCRPEIEDCELHPEEGTVECLEADTWVTYFSEDGVIEDDLSLRRTIFLGGVEPQLRTNVWPFLLHYYDFRTTFLKRQSIMEEKHGLYSRINNARQNMSNEEKERFWKAVQCTVEKDVVRTDRSKPCFAGPNNPNLEKMKNILLNFAFYNSEIGYTQGMSDILAPILAEVRNEADVFWCFTGMMSKTIFVTSPRDQDMEKNLRYLGELLHLMVPKFYDYVKLQDDGLDLLFCHRWILLCFKREFNEDSVLEMWEACWSNYQTDYFHLFLVVAIISKYGKEVWEQKMRPDEMLLYFASLANHMDGNIVLQKARGLLHNFRSKERIPCTLVGLCDLCGPGMWDSGHAPTVECVCNDGEPSPCQAAQLAVMNYSCSLQEEGETGEGEAPM